MGLARGISRPEARRDVLAVTLTLTTGTVDAVSFLHLGMVFSSVITGNMTLLGVAAGTHNGTLALNGGIALAGYAAGVIPGALIARTPVAGQPPWPRRVTAALTAEAGVLAGLSAGWIAADGHPSGVLQHALLALAAVAMGIQSAAVRRLGQLSTTYLTGTLTGVVVGLTLRQRHGEVLRNSAILASFVAGAVIGAVIARYAADWVPAAILAPIAGVVAVGWRPGTSASQR